MPSRTKFHLTCVRLLRADLTELFHLLRHNLLDLAVHQDEYSICTMRAPIQARRTLPRLSAVLDTCIIHAKYALRPGLCL